MLEHLIVDDFAGRLGEPFDVAHSGHAEKLILVEATAARSEPPAGQRRAFSLTFRGESRTAWLPQGIHALGHPDMPGLTLFLTCLGPSADGRFLYEAAFT